MTDATLTEARLALEERATLREQRRLLRAQLQRCRDELRAAMLESAMLRAEVEAQRGDDRRGAGSPG